MGPSGNLKAEYFSNLDREGFKNKKQTKKKKEKKEKTHPLGENWGNSPSSNDKKHLNTLNKDCEVFVPGN